MHWPLPTDYISVIEQPSRCFYDADLQSCEPESIPQTSLGHNFWYAQGNFGLVFKLNHRASQKSWAVKCFTRGISQLRKRYKRLAVHLRRIRRTCPYFVEFEYLEKGIQVDNSWYPIVKMEWVQGQTLDEWVKECLQSTDGP
ncbi:MAG: hypothetical protein RMI91_04625 [Gemmatales bacterium]|nr:hypothetical protein [Gemmatales bacterium]MDW7993921.1 hypothetical protein [Gemmatales bacterium]